VFNPFELHGAEFLLFFLVTLAITIPTALLLRFFFRLPAGSADAGVLDSNAYELAYMLGGEETGVAAGIAGLVQRKVLSLDAETGLLTIKKPLPVNASSVEKAIYNVVGNIGRTARSVVVVVGESLDEITENGRERGLVLTPTQGLLVRWVPAGLMMIVAGIGLIQMFLAKFVREGNRPIGFLLLLTIVPLVGAWMLFKWKAHRTARGDNLLEQARRENNALRISANKSPRSLTHDDMALAVGLFGIDILAGGAMKGLHQTLATPVHVKSTLGSHRVRSTQWWFFGSTCSTASSGCSSWSSCSSSSCGGGGGCGGGGCGGCGG